MYPKNGEIFFCLCVYIDVRRIVGLRLYYARRVEEIMLQ